MYPKRMILICKSEVLNHRFLIALYQKYFLIFNSVLIQFVWYKSSWILALIRETQHIHVYVNVLICIYIPIATFREYSITSTSAKKLDNVRFILNYLTASCFTSPCETKDRIKGKCTPFTKNTLMNEKREPCCSSFSSFYKYAVCRCLESTIHIKRN